MVFLSLLEVVEIVRPLVTVSPAWTSRRRPRLGLGIGGACGPNVLIIQIQGAQLVPKVLDHVQHYGVIRFTLVHWRGWR